MSENEFTETNRQNGLPPQQILDAGLNVFALKLLVESFTDLAAGNTTPLKFKFCGVDISLAISEP